MTSLDPVATNDGCQLAWQQLGEGPDVVLIHGLGANRAFWYAGLAQVLKARHRVTIYDLRAHGYSGRTPGGYSAAAQADDLRDLLDGLSIGSADVIGHSYGGSIALEFAARHPARLERLVLMDARINALQPEQWLSESPHLSNFEREIAAADGRDWDAEAQVGFAFLEAIARLRVRGFTTQVKDTFTPFGEGGGGLRAARRFTELIDQTSIKQDWLEKGADAAQLAAIGTPTLLLYGERSRCLASGIALQGLLPDARQALASQGGHFFPVTHQDWVAAQVLEFLGDETNN